MTSGKVVGVSVSDTVLYAHPSLPRQPQYCTLEPDPMSSCIVYDNYCSTYSTL